MRTSVLLFFGLITTCGSVVPVFADFIYHFKPGLEGQTLGSAQFVQVAPNVGPEYFKVLLAGSVVGSAPSPDVSTARAYLDRWGLGVLNPSAGKDLGVQGQVQLDATCGGEYLRLTFPVPVQLTFLTFASAGLADRFQLVADGTPVNLDDLFPGVATIRGISNAQGNWPGKIDFTLAQQPLGFAKSWDVLTFGAACGDGIQLENVGISEISEPSTLILWVVGLAAAGVLGVRRRIRVTH